MELDPARVTPQLLRDHSVLEIDDAIKLWKKHQLAQRLIDLVGCRHLQDGKKYLCLRDLDKHQREIVTWLSEIFALTNSHEHVSVYTATEITLHRRLASALLRAADRMGERKSMRTKEDKWYSCGNWQILPRLPAQ